MNTPIDKILSAQRSFFKSGATLKLDFRRKALRHLKQHLEKHEEDIFSALMTDLRKPRFESYATELSQLYKEIDLHIRNLRHWTKPKSVADSIVTLPSSSRIEPHPYGLNLIMGTWNYPVLLVLQPLIGAISAGNCALVKPSEHAPATAKLIKSICDTVFEEEYIAAVTGEKSLSIELVRKPFDHIFFTGSNAVGKHVMKAAAQTLTPVTLELGGKSPCLLDRELNWSLVAKRIVWGKMLNAGQTCLAPDYVCVHRDEQDEFISHLEKAIFDAYGYDPQVSPDFCRIINKTQFKRLDSLLMDVDLAIGGIADERDLYISPTVLKNVDWTDKVMEEEIFGPILPIVCYDHIDEAIDEINKRPTPLAFYLFSDHDEHQKELLSKVNFGGACVNDTIMHFVNSNLPFGGVGHSGVGSYHGKHTFNAFSHYRSIQSRSTLVDVPLRYPPYKGKMKYLRSVLKWFG